MIPSLFDALARIFRSSSRRGAHANAAAVERLKQHYQLQLPADFEAYLLERVPDDDWWDERHFVWWSLARIKSLSDECGADTRDEWRNPEIDAEADRYLVFADYLDWCYAYAICCAAGPSFGRIALIGAPARFVAETFSEFEALAAADSQQLHSDPG